MAINMSIQQKQHRLSPASGKNAEKMHPAIQNPIDSGTLNDGLKDSRPVQQKLPKNHQWVMFRDAHTHNLLSSYSNAKCLANTKLIKRLGPFSFRNCLGNWLWNCRST